METPLQTLTREDFNGLVAQRNELLTKHQNQQATIVRLEQTIAAQSKEILAQQAEAAHQKFQLDDLRRLIFSSKSERFVSAICPTQYALEFSVNTEMIGAVVEETRIKIAYDRKKTGKKHAGRTVDFPEHLPVCETVIEPEEDTSGMTCIGREVTKELELIASSLFVRHIIRPKYAEAEAEDGSVRIVIAPMPKRPIEKCMAGVELLTTMIIDKHLYHIPDYRQNARWQQQGVNIPTSTMGSWQENLSELFLPLYGALRSVALQTAYIQVDETRLAVQDRTKQGTTHKGWLWGYHAPLAKTVFFDYKKGRGEIHCRELLENFSGYLQTDNYAAYHKHKQRDTVVGVACWAHARRNFDKALGYDRPRAAIAMAMIQELYAVERSAREDSLSHAERQDLRMRISFPVATELFQWMQMQVVLPKSPLGKALAYALRLKNELMVYISDGRLEIDNNLMENAIRPIAIGRKNYMFAGSHDGAVNIAMYRSFFGTCQLNGINPYNWLRYVLLNINSTAPVDYHKLLPNFIDPNLLA